MASFSPRWKPAMASAKAASRNASSGSVRSSANTRAPQGLDCIVVGQTPSGRGSPALGRRAVRRFPGPQSDIVPARRTTKRVPAALNFRAEGCASAALFSSSVSAASKVLGHATSRWIVCWSHVPDPHPAILRHADHDARPRRIPRAEIHPVVLEAGSGRRRSSGHPRVGCSRCPR